MGGLHDWESELAPHYDEASGCSASSPTTGRRPGRPAAARVRRESSASATRTPRRRVGVLLRRAGRDGPRPVLRRRGARRAPAASRAGAAWSAARTARRTRSSRTTCTSPSARGAHGDARTHGGRHPPARRRGRLRRLRGHERALRRVAAQRDRRRSRARGVVVAAGALGTNKLLQRCQPRRLAAAHLRPPRRARAHQLRGDPRGHAPDGLPGRPDQARRDHSSIYPDPTRTSRRSPTATPATRCRRSTRCWSATARA